MASFKIKIKAPKSINVREWTWVIVIGGILTIISLISQGGLTLTPDTTGCRVAVAVDVLNERSGPVVTAPVVGTLTRGQVVPASKTVTASYRQLGDGRWVADLNVTPTAGSVCS
jgi:hypothetical protein